MASEEVISIENYIIKLRKTLHGIVSAIGDSVPYDNWLWNDSPSSSEYKNKIQEIIDDLKNFAKNYGLHFVNVYIHNDEAVFDTETILRKLYTMEELYQLSKNKEIKYSNYNELRYLKEDVIKCPLCNKRGRKHKIYEGYVFIGNIYVAHKLTYIIDALYEAIDNCKYKGNRSRIRENTYRAIIEIDNILLEKTLYTD